MRRTWGNCREAEAAQLRERVALVAHGGYGRRQQAPFSDVDLMVLYEGKRDTLIGQLASRLTQDICDVYQHLGHSLRTPAEAIQQARGDAQVGTSLLESRLLLGSSEVYDRYSELMKSLVEKRGRCWRPSLLPSAARSGWSMAKRFICSSRM